VEEEEVVEYNQIRGDSSVYIDRDLSRFLYDSAFFCWPFSALREKKKGGLLFTANKRSSAGGSSVAFHVLLVVVVSSDNEQVNRTSAAADPFDKEILTTQKRYSSCKLRTHGWAIVLRNRFVTTA